MSGEDCRDLTKINCQRKREGCDRSLPKVKMCRKCSKGRCGSLPEKVLEAQTVLKSSERVVLLRVCRRKECARGVCEGLPKVKIEPEGEGSRERACEEVR